MYTIIYLNNADKSICIKKVKSFKLLKDFIEYIEDNGMPVIAVYNGYKIKIN